MHTVNRRGPGYLCPCGEPSPSSLGPQAWATDGTHLCCDGAFSGPLCLFCGLQALPALATQPWLCFFSLLPA
eukprot:34734-Eustigmatos_ZCMA.PRE.1